MSSKHIRHIVARRFIGVFKYVHKLVPKCFNWGWASTIFIFLLSVLSFLHPAFCLGQEVKQNFTIKYLFSIDARVSGTPLEGVSKIFIDNKNNELYALDAANQRVVITDLNGTFLYQFTYADAGIKSMPVGITATDDGLLYIAE